MTSNPRPRGYPNRRKVAAAVAVALVAGGPNPFFPASASGKKTVSIETKLKLEKFVLEKIFKVLSTKLNLKFFFLDDEMLCLIWVKRRQNL